MILTMHVAQPKSPVAVTLGEHARSKVTLVLETPEGQVVMETTMGDWSQFLTTAKLRLDAVHVIPRTPL